MARVAVYFCGHIRNMKDTFANYRRVFSDPNVQFDYYFIFWTLSHSAEGSSWNKLNQAGKKVYDIRTITEQEVYSICPEAKKVVLLDEYTLSPREQRYDQAMVYQMYSLHKAFKEIPQGYDLYVRMRPDIYFFSGIHWQYVLNLKDTYNLFLSTTVHFTRKTYPHTDIFDAFFWISSYDIGKYLADIYLNVEELAKVCREKNCEQYFAEYLSRKKVSILNYPFEIALERRTRGIEDYSAETIAYTRRRQTEGDYV
jgi:hypothetical protein